MRLSLTFSGEDEPEYTDRFSLIWGKSMLKTGIALLALCATIVIAVVILDAHWIYVFAGSWGKGFGIFSLFFTWALFVTGIALTMIGLFRGLMRNDR